MECTLTMDNDSGYVSHHQESNLESSFENVDRIKMNPAQDLYLNEDTLLEKPAGNKEKPMHNDSFDSVINSSQESFKTEFSGFNDSGQSDASFVIPVAQPIVFYRDECPEKKDFPEECPSSKPKVLSNVTNTYDQNLTQAVIKNLTSKENKENIPPPSLTPKKPYVNSFSSGISPDLFDEEESSINVTVKQKSPMKKDTPKENHCSKDTKLLRNVQSLLSGVHPPPSVTIIQMNVTEMLEKINENKNLFWKISSTVTADVGRSLLLNDKPDCVQSRWPEVLKCRFHGLHHNRNKVSEEFEHLCLKYAERYVGNETQSSCTVFDSNPSSSQKRKITKPKWNVKSPGRRLSHLARRRITFSSANLQANSSSAILGSRARQILVDARKLNALRKSPRKSPRRTPSKSPFKTRKNTPSSSAKKKLALRFREMSGELETIVPSTSSESILSLKRTLFASESAPMEKKSTKRALFVSPLKHSPSKKSPLKFNIQDRKRKRTETDIGNATKVARRMSVDSQPASKPESSSFLNRTLSDTFNATKTEELSDQHKKKLQWAVYEALRLQNVTPSHPQYKVFASVLARVTRKFLPNLRFEGRTTEKMFRIARHHSYAVVKGKTVDEIFNEYVRNRMKNQKPQGYVGIEEFNRTRENLKDKENAVVQKENKVNIVTSIEKRREHAGVRTRNFSQNRIDRIKKVISFEETD